MRFYKRMGKVSWIPCFREYYSVISVRDFAVIAIDSYWNQVKLWPVLKSCETLASELSPVHHLQQDLKLWQKNLCLLVTWVPRHGGRQYLRLLLTSRSLLLTKLARHGGWPSREGWEGEKAKGGESHRVGKVQSSSISVHVFQFIYDIHIIHTPSFVYRYIFCLVHIYLWYRWVQQVPEWVGQQFYRHGLFCASQVILSPAWAKSFYCKNPWAHWSRIGLCWDHITGIVHSSGYLGISTLTLILT